MTRALVSLESEVVSLKKRIEEYIQELIRTDTEVVRNSIQNSIVDLEAQREQLREKRLFVNHSIEELKRILSNDTDLFTEYSRRIHAVLNPDLLTYPHVADRRAPGRPVALSR